VTPSKTPDLSLIYKLASVYPGKNRTRPRETLFFLRDSWRQTNTVKLKWMVFNTGSKLERWRREGTRMTRGGSPRRGGRLERTSRQSEYVRGTRRTGWTGLGGQFRVT